jgi:hypothetical protein
MESPAIRVPSILPGKKRKQRVCPSSRDYISEVHNRIERFGRGVGIILAANKLVISPTFYHCIIESRAAGEVESS